MTAAHPLSPGERPRFEMAPQFSHATVDPAIAEHALRETVVPLFSERTAERMDETEARAELGSRLEISDNPEQPEQGTREQVVLVEEDSNDLITNSEAISVRGGMGKALLGKARGDTASWETPRGGTMSVIVMGIATPDEASAS